MNTLRKKTKILHLASFIGNIGDNASHIGLYNILDKVIKNHKVTQVEIRKLYKNYTGENKLVLDQEFISYLNGFDLCFIGGGGFLDYWVKDSQTGTTLDIDPKLIRRIQIPVFITSIGSNPHREIPKGNIDKFKTFLSQCKKNENIKIILRNDGSYNSILNDLGNDYLIGIDEILDHGFFYKPIQNYPRLINKKYIAINVTKDQLEMVSRFRGKIEKEKYNNEMVRIVDYIIEELKKEIIFIPHIYSDLEAINGLISIIDQNKVRNNISVAPLLQGNDGAHKVFSIYEHAEQVIATRLHANICSIAMNKKVIGLQALDRIYYLYQSIGSPELSVPLSGKYSSDVIDLLKSNSLFNRKELGVKKNKTMSLYEEHLAHYGLDL